MSFVIFLFWVIQNCKSALSEEMDKIGSCGLLLPCSRGLSTKTWWQRKWRATPSSSVLNEWAAGCKRGRQSLEDDLHPGGLTDVTTQEIRLLQGWLPDSCTKFVNVGMLKENDRLSKADSFHGPRASDSGGLCIAQQSQEDMQTAGYKDTQ